ncbi:MAG: DUF4147 domain-containing protein [Planctomycetota bacterium]|nr:DUF4147 domain-containing protein [Planctomycetota bacterium]
MKTNAEPRTQNFWKAGILAVDSTKLVESQIDWTQNSLSLAGHPIPFADFEQLIITGAGKASAGMAKGLIPVLKKISPDKKVTGWINVPDNCVEPHPFLTLHGGRPASLNEPTEKGRKGAKKILELVHSATEKDLVICLISGGGSALTPLPIDGVPLESKQKMTRFLGQNGATINQLNCVRSAISQIKAGGLVRGFQGHSFHSLIISDVPGNPLDVIASGMTVPNTVDCRKALSILQLFDPERKEVDSRIYDAIGKRDKTETGKKEPIHTIFNHIIGDNTTAIQAMRRLSLESGNETETHLATTAENDVESVANAIWQKALQRIGKGNFNQPYYFISGGEPTVKLNDPHGKGGRNQHLALLILEKIMRSELCKRFEIEFTSVGTDGEDGPTNAAGASVNSAVIENAIQQSLDPLSYLSRHDSYHFFQKAGGLLVSGPTHTNVGDLRVLAIYDR